MREALADARSLAYHAAMIAKIDRDPRWLEPVHATIARWRATGDLTLKAWAEVFAWRLNDWPKLRAELLAPGDESAQLRNCSPFLRILSPQERNAIFYRVGIDHAARGA
jgi:hypothetical protein